MMVSFKELKTSAENISVLYVEDDADIRETISTFLRKIFTKVDTAADGLAGLHAYKKTSYDLVLTDIQMPKMDGLTMAGEIRMIQNDQEIIVVSAYSDSDYFLDAIRLGVSGFILKPVDFAQMYHTLYMVTDKISRFRENINYRSRLEELVTAQTKKIEQQSQRLLEKAKIDQLTGVFNHFVLLEALEERGGKSLILLNIDNFSALNDSYGFAQGDKVLKEIARLLEDLKPQGSRLFRLNADEFVILSDIIERPQIEATVKTLLSFFTQSQIEPFDIELNLTLTAGIDIGDSRELLSNAKMAVQEVRQGGRNQYMFYDDDSEFLKRQKENLHWVHKIQDILEQDKLRPYFQPILNNHTGAIEKYECLARIEEGDEVFSPWKFVSAAERTGFLSNITKNMIKKSFQIFASNEYEFSINITSHDLLQGYLLDYIIQRIHQFDIHPGRLVLEVLEDITFVTDDKIISQLKRLKAHGCQIAIDDFGSENSNFSRFLDFDPDYIKIDGSFVRDLTSDTKSQAITEAIATFAKKRNIKVIAEFVHDRATYELVKSMGIDYSQGYFIGKPSPELQLSRQYDL